MTDLFALFRTTLSRGAAAMLLIALLAPTLHAMVVANASFETPVYAVNSHNYNGITGTQWTHTGRSGIDNGNPFSGSNTAPFVGDQMAFLQGDNGWTNGVTSLGQELSGLVVGQPYTLSFQAKGINAYSFTNPFNVSINGSDMFGLLTPGTGAYEQYVSDSFIATSTTMDLLFYDQGDITGGKVSFIDDVQVYETPVPNLVINGGFETPAYAGDSHNYSLGIDGSSWTPTGRAGIHKGDTVFGASNFPAEDDQMGFLQGDAGNTSTPAPDGVTSLTQDISDLVVGQDYTLSFQAKALVGYSGVNPFYVSVGGTDLFGLITPGGADYEHFSTSFTATDATMSLKLYDQGNVAGGQVTWIDAVQINPVPEPGTLSLLLAGIVALFGVRTRRSK